MNFAEFEKIYADLPHDIALFYSDVKRKFNLTHEQAYATTLKVARDCGCAVGSELGKPAHESKSYRLLLRKEL